MTRYTLRFGTTVVPMVEVLHPSPYPAGHRQHEDPRVERRIYGFTTQHAYRRALRWVRQNGDPR